ncbi:chloride channel protein [Streptomyces sp. NPDC053048]|uniref:chloride channel protein n=1 Tax=Streptomyces sp. NPDC053048 TaxID=3365694 RepID=UPI0037D76B04
MSGIPTADSAGIPAGTQPPRHHFHPRISGPIHRIRQAPWALAVLAPATGAAAALGAVAFHWLADALTRVFCGHTDCASAARAAHPLIPGLGPYVLFVAPVIGGMLYGPLIHRFAPGPGGHGLPELMLAASRADGRVVLRPTLVRALASAVCIGSGGSLGRTGPIVQLGSALGSLLTRLAKAPQEHNRLLLACGAAGGVTAAFDAPLAGAFFAMELILRSYTVESFGAVAFAALGADAVTRTLSGTTVFLDLPDLAPVDAADLPPLILLGTAAAVVSVAFTRILYRVEDACTWAWRGPQWLRPAAGGLLLGALLLALPQLHGSGYQVLKTVTDGHYLPGFLLLLLAGKIFATSLTLGIGGAGGVLAPSLFIGAALGAAYADGLRTLLPGVTGPTALYALAGMAAVFAGSSHTPATAIVFAFELTGQYMVVLPVMLTVITATFTARLLFRHTIHTLKLARRGIILSSPDTRPPSAV